MNFAIKYFNSNVGKIYSSVLTTKYMVIITIKRAKSLLVQLLWLLNNNTNPKIRLNEENMSRITSFIL